MNNKQIPKLKLLLSSLIYRLSENREYFSDITVLYKSGTKEFPLVIEDKEGKLVSSYMGISKEIKENDIPDVIIENLDKYDSVKINYEDRMSGLIIEADDKRVESKKSTGKEKLPSVAAVGGRDYIIKENEASELLKAIGIMADNGKVKNDMIRKYNQIDRFVELISDVEVRDNLNIMDCGCGKSYLSFVLNYYYTEVRKKKCNVYGIDFNKEVIKASEKMAKSLNYNNMQFFAADLKEFSLDKKVDIVISLHACDVATDYAIYSGLKHNSKMIISVPCCHKELMGQIENDGLSELLKHGVYKNRFCDMLTDTMRALLMESRGYKVSVIEYISPLDTPKNVMLKAVKVGGENKKALEEYYKLKNMFSVNPTLETLMMGLDF